MLGEHNQEKLLFNMEGIIMTEQQLFKITKAVLKWANVEYTQEELAELVMSELINIKES